MTVNIFAFTQRPELKMLLEVQCKDLAGFAPVIKDSIDEFISLLGLVNDIKLVIVDPSSRDDNEVLFSELKYRDIKNVFVLANKGSHPEFSYFGVQGIEELMAKLRSFLTPDSVSANQYISIPIDSFIHFKMVPFDLYIKLGEDKHIKRVPAGEDIDEDLIKGLKAKNVNELWFERKYNKDFSLLLMNNMINKVESSYNTAVEKIKATSEVFATTKEIVQSVGLPGRVIEVCESVMDSITADVARSKDKFSSYLTAMKSSELNFQYRFIELTSFLATMMVEAMDAPGDKVKTIVFCAFFCDIALKESEHVELRTEESIKDLWPEDKENVLSHALKASEIVSKYKNAPAGADLIVKQHHGSMDGKGFPALCGENVLPLAKCLMASQIIAHALLKNQDKKPKDVVAELVTKYEGRPLHPYLQLIRLDD